MLGESGSLKTILSKSKLAMPSGEIKSLDMASSFTLTKFANEIDCNHVFFDQPWFVKVQTSNLQRWRRDFDPFKESTKWVGIWVHLPGLPVELWSESIRKKLLKQIERVIKIVIDLEEVSKGHFAKMCVEVDITKPLKLELKYKRGNVTKPALIYYLT